MKEGKTGGQREASDHQVRGDSSHGDEEKQTERRDGLEIKLMDLVTDSMSRVSSPRTCPSTRWLLAPWGQA